jgi:hypothetical protein
MITNDHRREIPGGGRFIFGRLISGLTWIACCKEI